jgi:2',3'-cyclic-nucleotide 2'-phosphodiesterase (5'-nucleotidase family)
MDALQKRIKQFLHFFILAVMLMVWALPMQAQTIKTSRILMDTVVFAGYAMPAVQRIMDTYSPELHKQMGKVVGYTVSEMRSYSPESPLSNLAADALLAVARTRYGKDGVDFSLTNFGGIRTSLPKGDVRLYDIYAVFPFENTLVLISMKGSQVRELFNAFARTRVEVLGGVSLKIKNRSVTELLINGKPLDDNKIYRVATIDFLLSGGDKVSALKDNLKVNFSGITVRDVILRYIEVFTRNGEPIPAKTDGRVTVDKASGDH